MSTIEIEPTDRKRAFRGDVLRQTYEPLVRSAETDDQRTQLIVEYLALNRCYQVYVQWDRRALELMTRGGMSDSRSWGKLDRMGGRALVAADYERGVETNA